ncbi:MAG: hypothetical protein FHP92_19830 [Denitromonas halophila]|nr:MAG: hypothetical protein FHP92_19830 [Denitromonas halophila]
MDVSILLVHAFFPDSPGLAGSRGELAFWLAQKLEATLSNRFSYRRIIVSRDGQQLEGFSELRTAIAERSKTTSQAAQPTIPPDLSRQAAPVR